MSSVIKTWHFLRKTKNGGRIVEIPALISLPLHRFPDYAELGIKKLSNEEKEQYRRKVKYLPSWDVDLKKLKEFIVVDMESWFLVRWA